MTRIFSFSEYMSVIKSEMDNLRQSWTDNGGHNWPSCCREWHRSELQLAVQCHAVWAASDTTRHHHWMYVEQQHCQCSAGAALAAGWPHQCALWDDHETSCTSRPTYTTLVSIHRHSHHACCTSWLMYTKLVPIHRSQCTPCYSLYTQQH